MGLIVRFVRGFGRFWYDFLVGDDPKIALGVATVLVVGVILVVAGAPSGPVMVGLTALLLAAFTAAMVVDVSRSRRRS